MGQAGDAAQRAAPPASLSCASRRVQIDRIVTQLREECARPPARRGAGAQGPQRTGAGGAARWAGRVSRRISRESNEQFAMSNVQRSQKEEEPSETRDNIKIREAVPAPAGANGRRAARPSRTRRAAVDGRGRGPGRPRAPDGPTVT